MGPLSDRRGTEASPVRTIRSAWLQRRAGPGIRGPLSSEVTVLRARYGVRPAPESRPPTAAPASATGVAGAGQVATVGSQLVSTRPIAASAAAMSSSDRPAAADGIGQVAGIVGPGRVSPGRVAPGDIRPGCIAPGDRRPCRVAPGNARPGSVRPGSVRPGSVAPGSRVPGRVRLGSGRPSHRVERRRGPGSVARARRDELIEGGIRVRRVLNLPRLRDVDEPDAQRAGGCVLLRSRPTPSGHP